jgi:hypothetical protein
VAEDGDISIVDGGGITELDPAGDRLLVDISGFADEWLLKSVEPYELASRGTSRVALPLSMACTSAAGSPICRISSIWLREK